MAQDERDYWYRPKEFRARVSPDLMKSIWPKKEPKRADDYNWHWFEVFIGASAVLTVVLVFPEQFYSVVDWLIAMREGHPE